MTVWRRLAAFGALVIVAVLGDLRGTVVAATPPNGTDGVVVTVETAPRLAVRAVRSETRDPGVPVQEDSSDDARLVPAIYAWDPDVRFVYYRHISKWM